MGDLGAMLRDWLAGVPWLTLGLFADPFSRTGIAVMLVGWIIGAAAYVHYRPEGAPFGLTRYLAYAFDRKVWLSRSAAVDVMLMLVGRLLAPSRWLLGGITAGLAAVALAAGLIALLGPREPLVAPGPLGTALLGAALVLVYDFATYVTHRLSHRVPVLWAFHRVHHSAEALNPLTVARKHPVYDAVAVVIDCLIAAPLQALVIYLWGAEVTGAALAAMNLGFGLFAYAASSLRHTHIWLDWGPLLGRVLVSPAQHQIHHSRSQRHWDRNYGEVFALWDWLLGSHYLPREREEVEFGLAGEEVQPHPGLISALAEPFVWIARRGWAAQPAAMPPA